MVRAQKKTPTRVLYGTLKPAVGERRVRGRVKHLRAWLLLLLLVLAGGGGVGRRHALGKVNWPLFRWIFCLAFVSRTPCKESTRLDPPVLCQVRLVILFLPP